MTRFGCVRESGASFRTRRPAMIVEMTSDSERLSLDVEADRLGQLAKEG